MIDSKNDSNKSKDPKKQEIIDDFSQAQDKTLTLASSHQLKFDANLNVAECIPDEDGFYLIGSVFDNDGFAGIIEDLETPDEYSFFRIGTVTGGTIDTVNDSYRAEVWYNPQFALENPDKSPTEFKIVHNGVKYILDVGDIVKQVEGVCLENPTAFPTPAPTLKPYHPTLPSKDDKNSSFATPETLALFAVLSGTAWAVRKMIAGARQRSLDDQDPQRALEMTSLKDAESDNEESSNPYHALSEDKDWYETVREQAGNFSSAVAGGAGYVARMLADGASEFANRVINSH